MPCLATYIVLKEIEKDGKEKIIIDTYRSKKLSKKEELEIKLAEEVSKDIDSIDPLLELALRILFDDGYPTRAWCYNGMRYDTSLGFRFSCYIRSLIYNFVALFASSIDSDACIMVSRDSSWCINSKLLEYIWARIPEENAYEICLRFIPTVSCSFGVIVFGTYTGGAGCGVTTGIHCGAPNTCGCTGGYSPSLFIPYFYFNVSSSLTANKMYEFTLKVKLS